MAPGRNRFAWANFEDEPEVFIKEFVKPFWEAVDENRSKYLRPYPMVLETLEALKRKGVKVVALSDAPEYMARVRNKQIFDGLLDAVYSLETVEPEKHDPFRPISFTHGRERVAQLRRKLPTCKLACTSFLSHTRSRARLDSIKF